MWSTIEALPDRRKSYVRQLIDAFVLLGLVMGLLVPLILFWNAWQQARLFSIQTSEELARILAEDARYALLVGSHPDAQALVETLLKFPDLVRVQLDDAAGQIVAVAEQTAGEGTRSQRTIQIVTQVLYSRPQALPTAALSDPSAVLGRVVLTLSLDRAFDVARDAARNALLQLGVLMLLLGVVVARLTRRMLAPLAALVGRLGDPLGASLPVPPMTSPTEIHQLHAAISTMRSRLAAHASELEARVAARTQEGSLWVLRTCLRLQ